MKLITVDEVKDLEAQADAAWKEYSRAKETLEPMLSKWCDSSAKARAARDRLNVQEEVLREYRDTLAAITPTPELVNV